MNASARHIYRAQKFCPITPLLAELHWLPVRSRIHYKILLITFKVLHGLSPKYLSDLISIQQPLPYNLRRNDNSLRSSRFLSFLKRRGDRTSERKADKRGSTPGASKSGEEKREGGRKREKEGRRSGEEVRRLTPSPYCLFCHSFAVFLPFASVWKRKGNGCYGG